MTDAYPSRSNRELEEENLKLRIYIARSSADCVYCGLPKNRMTECRSGFPGCGRMDDILEGERQAVLPAMREELKKKLETGEVVVATANEADARIAKDKE